MTFNILESSRRSQKDRADSFGHQTVKCDQHWNDEIAS